MGNTASAVVVSAGIGTVRRVASATNPSVPSDPITSFCRISTGESASRNALMPYPIVFFSENIRSIAATDSGFSRTRFLSRSSPS